MLRLEWRPSRWLATALVLLGLLAACAVITCEMPRWCAFPLALASMLRGAWLARACMRCPRHDLAWPLEGDLVVDGRRAEATRLHWRGSLAFLAWTDPQGGRRRLAWWPDTLSRGERRELRLAASAAPNAPPLASMAP